VIDGQLQFVFSEYERTTRNLLGNCHRNQSQITVGRKEFLIVVDHEKMRAAVRRTLRRHLPPESARKFAVILLSRIEQSLKRQ
jgi:hypothetical protein